MYINGYICINDCINIKKLLTQKSTLEYCYCTHNCNTMNIKIVLIVPLQIHVLSK